MKSPVHDRYQLATVNRVVAVIESFDGAGSLRQADIARAVGLSEATTLRYLSSLASHRLVERDERTGKYRLGLRLFELAASALSDGQPRDAARPVMTQLLERFGETVNLGVRDGDSLVLIEALEGTRSIRKGAMVGGRDSWHASALGKAILAYIPEADAESLLARSGCPRLTSRTLTSPEQVIRELANIRVIGYAFDKGEAEDDLRCVAAPIFDRHGSPACAISVSGPANRLPLAVMKDMGTELRAAAATVSIRLGYTPWRQ